MARILTALFILITSVAILGCKATPTELTSGVPSGTTEPRIGMPADVSGVYNSFSECDDTKGVTLDEGSWALPAGTTCRFRPKSESRYESEAGRVLSSAISEFDLHFGNDERLSISTIGLLPSSIWTGDHLYPYIKRIRRLNECLQLKIHCFFDGSLHLGDRVRENGKCLSGNCMEEECKWHEGRNICGPYNSDELCIIRSGGSLAILLRDRTAYVVAFESPPTKSPGGGQSASQSTSTSEACATALAATRLRLDPAVRP